MTIFILKITIFSLQKMKRGSREDEDEVAEQQQVPEENDDVFFLRAECRRRGISAGGSVALLKGFFD